MKILVTGGLGYIGSHTCVELYKSGHEPIIVDNLSNCSLKILDSLEKITGEKLDFFNLDVRNYLKMEEIFENNDIDAVIHFAGYKSVEESILDPIKYYDNNINTTLVLLKLCGKYNVDKFIFSSSATVYGDNLAPYSEEMVLGETNNPYGDTKLINEKIIKNYSLTNKDFNFVILRYFNPIGAHESSLIGDFPTDIPNNLMPYITKVASGKLECLRIFGNDYPTRDGTCIRDYIHVVDLAKGHVAALRNSQKGFNIFNLGTGKGTSVKELVEYFEKENGIKICREFVDRRDGDVPECYACVEKAKQQLDWEAEKSIKEMVIDSWNFEKNLK
ncbi:MAG: UDP-glucose 4-epimerase GalE [Clostridiales bacterium]|nr:MAG: UDP-glucose 4-epimerase GalE [Clostridiales bacterium]